MASPFLIQLAPCLLVPQIPDPVSLSGLGGAVTAHLDSLATVPCSVIPQIRVRFHCTIGVSVAVHPSPPVLRSLYLDCICPWFTDYPVWVFLTQFFPCPLIPQMPDAVPLFPGAARIHPGSLVFDSTCSALLGSPVLRPGAIILWSCQ